MCAFGKSQKYEPYVPPPLPDIPVVPETPRLQDDNVRSSRLKERKRLRAMKGGKSTIATSGTGLQSNANTGNVILG